MKQFVFLFQQGPAALPESDQKRRADQVRAWAQRQNNEGRKLDPRKLGDEHQWIGSSSEGDRGAPADSGSLTAFLFLEARDFAEAVRIAKTHPGLHFGASVEVREWAPPLVQPASPQTSR